MDKQVDIRCYISADFKKKIKQIALDKNTSVNKLLNDLLHREFGEAEEQKLQEELNLILLKLKKSALLSETERNNLKQRKRELKLLLKGENENGKQ